MSFQSLKRARSEIKETLAKLENDRQRLREMLKKQKASTEERLGKAQEELDSARLGLENSLNKELEADKLIRNAKRDMGVYEKRHEFVDAIDSGIVQSGNGMVTNLNSVNGGVVQAPDGSGYISATSRLTPVKLSIANDNLKKAVVDRTKIEKQRDELAESVEQLSEKRAVLRIELLKAKAAKKKWIYT